MGLVWKWIYKKASDYYILESSSIVSLLNPSIENLSTEPTMTNFVNGGYWVFSTVGQLPPTKIDAKLYTHLFCRYAGIDSRNYEVMISFGEYNIINSFSSEVRKSNPNVKTLLSIRGGREVFSEMARDPLNRDAFIKSSITAAIAGEFNGLDLRWLYPSSQEDMQNF